MVEALPGKEKLDLKNQIIVFIGPEGSGKTDNAKKLAAAFDKKYLTTGGAIRDLAATDLGPLGDECRAMFAENKYLAGPTLLKVVGKRLENPDTVNGFILDGGLRTVAETEGFRKMLIGAGRDLPVTVVYLYIPIWTSFERLLTGSNARKRKDANGAGDTREGITKRLAEFYSQLNNRLDIIEGEKGWNLVRVDATPTFDEVFANMIDNLTQLSRSK
jgi:adenylate kinase